jgi:hypothetical protein
VFLRGIGRERELYGSKVTDSVLQLVHVTCDRSSPNTLSTSSLQCSVVQCMIYGRKGQRERKRGRRYGTVKERKDRGEN